MVYTNVIIKKLENEYEIAAEDVEWDKESGIETKINDYPEFLQYAYSFYCNYEKGQVDDVEFDDGMKTIKDFLDLFENTEITYRKSFAEAIDSLLSIEK